MSFILQYTPLRHKLFVIVPMRNRESELKTLIPKLENTFKHQNIDYRIFIVEQDKEKLFNKGKLINAGFKEILNKHPNATNFVFHDVDIQPQDPDIINYKFYGNGLRHPYGVNLYLGGIVFSNKKSFLDINGFSNEFWGWGFEDTDLQLRTLLKKIPIDRTGFINRRSTPRILDPFSQNTGNKTDSINREVFNSHKSKYESNIETINNDGLSNCEYLVRNTATSGKITRLLISL